MYPKTFQSLISYAYNLSMLSAGFKNVMISLIFIDSRRTHQSHQSAIYRGSVLSLHSGRYYGVWSVSFISIAAVYFKLYVVHVIRWFLLLLLSLSR